MKAVIVLINSIFNSLFSVPLFDTGVSFGAFLMALVLFDITLIILHHVMRKNNNQSGNKSPNNNTGGVKQ